jgi:hypothetical protein
MFPPSAGGVVGVAFMVGTSWYQRKADECARLAEKSDHPRHRSRMEAESRLWRQIALSEARHDENARPVNAVGASIFGHLHPARLAPGVPSAMDHGLRRNAARQGNNRIAPVGETARGRRHCGRPGPNVS